MIGFTRCSAIVIFVAVALANAGSKSVGESMGFQPTLGLNAKFTEDVTVKLRGGLNIKSQLEQVDEYYYQYSNEGLTAKEVSAGIEVKIGKFGRVEITGGGDFLVLSRAMDDTMVSRDYFEVRPAGLLNITLPFAGIFNIRYLSRFERRIFYEPGLTLSHFRYNSETRLSMDGILPLQTGMFVFYDGFLQKGSTSMCQWGGGITMEPVKNLCVEAGYSMLWKPEYPDLNIFPIFLGISYTFDFSE